MDKVYSNPALTTEQLLKLFQAKRISVLDPTKAAFRLRSVSYHRLSPYLECVLRNHHSHPTFEDAWDLYRFDRELRLLLNDAIERIEVGFRTALSDTMSQEFSPHWFLKQELFNIPERHYGFMEQVKLICKDAQEPHVQKYYKQYNAPLYPPSWVIFESLSLGSCISIFCNIKELKNRKKICDLFQEHPTTLRSWLYAIRYTRNLCAHHSRVWNRWFVVTPALAFLYDGFNKDHTFYAQLIIINRLLKKISPNSTWSDRLKNLLEKYPNIPVEEMGFTTPWTNDAFWNQ